MCERVIVELLECVVFLHAWVVARTCMSTATRGIICVSMPRDIAVKLTCVSVCVCVRVQHAARHRWDSVQRLSAILHEVHDAEVAALHTIYQLHVCVSTRYSLYINCMYASSSR